MMSSDLYGTCSSSDVIVMSRTNSNLSYGTQYGHNCNQFGNIATVTASCKTLHWRTMQTSFTVSVISFIIQVMTGFN